MAGSVSASLRHGIWMISFFTSLCTAGILTSFSIDAVPGDLRCAALVPRLAQRRSRRAPVRPPMPALNAPAIAAGSGSQTNPLTPSSTNSSVPPESRAVTTGLRARNASSVT